MLRLRISCAYALAGVSIPILLYVIVYAVARDSILLRSPFEVAAAGARIIRGELWPHVGATSLRWLFALVGAAFGGVLLGIVLRLSSRLWIIARPALDFFRSTPATTYAALVMILVPLGTAIQITALIANLLIMTLYTALALEQAMADETRLFVARFHGAGTVQLFRSVIIPRALPMVLDGMQVILSLSLIYVIALEAIIGGSDKGLGIYVFELKGALRIAEMYAVIYCAGLFGFVANWLFGAIRPILHPWHKIHDRG